MAGAAFNPARPRDSLLAGGADDDVEESPRAGGPRGRRARPSGSRPDARRGSRRPPRALTAAPPPPLEPLAPRLGLVGLKLRAPQTRTSEAGLTWALSDRVTLNLTYERTAYAPLMPHDHDDGILTGVKLGF